MLGSRAALVAAALVVTPAFTRQPPRWRLVEEWRVGGEVQGPHAFDNVRDIDVLPDGRLIVLDGKDQQIHILGARGTPVRTIGRTGSGPGEFRGATGVVVAPDGRFVVSDDGNSRFALFTPTGEFIRTVTRPGFGAPPWIAQIDGRGRLSELGIVLRVLPDREFQFWPAIRVWNEDLSRADTVVTPDCADTPLVSQWDYAYRVVTGERSNWQAAYQWARPTLREAVGGDGAFWTSGGPAHCRLVRTTMATCERLASVTLDAGHTIPPDVRGAGQDAMRRLAQGQAGNPFRPDPDKVPATLPAFVALGADAGDRLWVERFTGERLRYLAGSRTSMAGTPGGPRRFDVFSATGARVAELAAPDSVTFVRPVAITQDRLYAFVPDDDGMLYLVAYRIEQEHR